MTITSKLPDVGTSIFAVMSALAAQHGAVILSQGFPEFDSYVTDIRLNGGKPVAVPMTFPDYRMEWNAVEGAFSPKTRWFVISFFGKTYHAAGWEIGYCVAPPHLSRELRRVHQYLTFASCTPIQWAYADILTDPSTYLDRPAFYQQMRDRFLALIEPSRFHPLPCRGTYFQMLDDSAISDLGDVDFARRLTIEHQVAATPPSVFYHDGEDNQVPRFCLAEQDATPEEAAQRLCRI